ncbi:MAG: septum formation protein Maf [Clostridia bacterium]|nr:septum formation protein Maf [Clostridia bacterium]
MKIVLASKSPRRRELLSRLVEKFEIKVADADESLPEGMHPREGVELLAVRKGTAVLPTEDRDTMIISSDTLVELGGKPLGKPKDREDAMQMLKMLSGNTHNVHTGVAVHYRGRVFSGVHTSRVTFREMTEEEIDGYIATGEPMDKAGAYGIQGIGGKFVLGFDGEFESIMGLSLTLTERLMREAKSGEEES